MSIDEKISMYLKEAFDDQEFIKRVLNLGSGAYDAIPTDKFKKLSDDEVLKIVVMAAMKKDKAVKSYWLKKKTNSKFVEKVKKEILDI